MAAGGGAACVHRTLCLLRGRSAWASSPAAGVALHRWPTNQLALATFLQQRAGTDSKAGETGAGAGDDGRATELALALFHAAEDGAPLRSCRNRSLPASWLAPELLGRTLALSASAPPEGSAEDPKLRRAALERLGIRSNHVADVRSGVSLVRFEQLLPLLAAEPSAVARAACLKASAEGGGDTAASRASLLRYMHGAGLLNPEAEDTLLTDGTTREAWLHAAIPNLSDEAAGSAAARLLADCSDASRWTAEQTDDTGAVLLALVQEDVSTNSAIFRIKSTLYH